MPQQNGWDVVSVTPDPTYKQRAAAKRDDGWQVVSVTPDPNYKPQPTPFVDMSKVAGATPGGPPQLPVRAAAPSGITPMTTSQKLFGVTPLSDTAGNMWQHAKGQVAGLYHAFADPVSSQEIQRDPYAKEMLDDPMSRGLYRIMEAPTLDALQDAHGLYETGGSQVNSWNPSKYDQQGNYVPTVASKLFDAIPIIGPWSRNVENEAHQQGVLPALAGFGVDAATPAAIQKGVGLGASAGGRLAETAGKGLEYLGATTEAKQLAATRKLVSGSPGEVLTRALKPAVTYGGNADEMFNDTLPSLLKTNQNISSVKSFAQAADDAKAANAAHYNALLDSYREGSMGLYGDGPRSALVDGVPIAEAQYKSVPYMDEIEKPGPGGILDKTADVASLYDRLFTVPELDKLRLNANGKLNAFYNKAGGDQFAALSNPETARVKAVGDTTRDLLYGQLGKDHGIPASEIANHQRLYGELTNVSDIANKRQTVFGRHDPISFAEKVATTRSPWTAATDFAIQKLFKKLTDSDALVNSAVDRYNNPTGTPLTRSQSLMWSPDSDAGRLLQAAGRASRGAGSSLRTEATLPSLYFVPPYNVSREIPDSPGSFSPQLLGDQPVDLYGRPRGAMPSRDPYSSLYSIK